MLAGRDDEIHRLTSLVDESLSGPGHLRLVQLEGEIGAGKSALLAAVIGRLRRREQLAQQGTLPAPYLVLAHGDRQCPDARLSAFRVFCEDLLGDPLDRLLERATPSVLALRCSEALDLTPLVIAVDDAQWLDAQSVVFLETLMQHPTNAPVTVLVAHRTGHAPLSLISAAHRRGALHDHHTVSRLPDAVIAEIAAELPEHQVAAVVQAAKGNPLFAHTAVAGFLRHPGAREVDEALRSVDASRSAVLASAIAPDLATLSERARRTLETLAIVGDTDAASIAHITHLDRDEVLAGARELAKRGLITENARGVMHPVVRFGVYQNTDTKQRARFHRQAAHLPDTELFERAEHLADVLINGGARDESSQPMTASEVKVLIEASRLAIGSNPEAIRRWLGNLAPVFQTPQSEMLLARAMILTGDFDEAVVRLRALVEEDDSAETQILLVNALRMTGQVDEARARLATAHLWANGAEATLLREYIDVVALIDGTAPDELLSRLESLADRSASGMNRAVAAIYRTMSLLSEGRVPQARVTFRRVVKWAARVSNDELASVPHATCAAVWSAYILDQLGFGASLASRALQLARSHGQADVLANLGVGLTFCQASLGLLEKAEENGERAVRDALEYGPESLVGMARAGLMIAAQGRGDLALLQRRFDELVATPLPEFGWFRRAVLTTRTRVSAMLGQPEPCLELLGKPRDALAALRHADAAVVAAVLGDPDTAKTLLDDGRAIAEEQGQEGQRAMILTTEAELLLHAGDALHAGNLFRAAREVFEQRDMRLQLWRAQAGIARAEAVLAQQAEPLAQLTEREREIAQVIAEGLSNKAIAERLVLSHRTVENHVRNILKKLGVDSRQQIIEIAAPSRLRS